MWMCWNGGGRYGSVQKLGELSDFGIFCRKSGLARKGVVIVNLIESLLLKVFFSRKLL